MCNPNFIAQYRCVLWSLILHYLSDQCSVLQGVCDILSIPCSPRVLVDPTVWKFSAQLPRCKTPPLPILHTWSSVRSSGGSNGKPDRWCQDNGGRVQQVEESCVVATLRFFCILWSMFWVEGLTCERLTPKKKWNSVIYLPQCPVSDPWYFRCLDLFGFHIVWSSKLWYAVPIIKLDLPDIWFVPDPCKHVQGPTSYALTHSCAFWGWTPNAVWIFLFPFKMWWPLWTKQVAHM